VLATAGAAAITVPVPVGRHGDLLTALVQRLLRGFEGGHHAHAVPAVGAGPGPGGHALQEVVELQRQGLGEVGARHVQVAGAQPELVLAELAHPDRVGALVVDPQLGLGVEVVEDHHAARADHGGAPQLGRVQPGDVQVGQDAAVVAEGGEDHVLHVGVQVAGAPGGDPAGRRADQVVGDGDVVRADRPQRVDVALDAAQVHALGVQVAQLAQVAGLQQGAHLGHRRVVLEGVADQQHQPARLGLLGQGDRVGGGEGQRLLHQHVLAGAQPPSDQVGVGARGRGDHQRVDRPVGQHLAGVAAGPHPRVALLDLGQAARVGVDARRPPHAEPQVQVAGQVRPPVAVPQQGDPHAPRRHRRPSALHHGAQSYSCDRARRSSRTAA
jgi:hypothetical protein